MNEFFLLEIEKKYKQVFVNILMQFVGATYVFAETPLLPECETPLLPRVTQELLYCL